MNTCTTKETPSCRRSGGDTIAVSVGRGSLSKIHPRVKQLDSEIKALRSSRANSRRGLVCGRPQARVKKTDRVAPALAVYKALRVRMLQSADDAPKETAVQIDPSEGTEPAEA